MASDKVKIIMLACVCPGSSSSDHTLNTLRYAERLKDRSGNNNVQGIQNQQHNYLEQELRQFKSQIQANNNNYMTNENEAPPQSHP